MIDHVTLVELPVELYPEVLQQELGFWHSLTDYIVVLLFYTEELVRSFITLFA